MKIKEVARVCYNALNEMAAHGLGDLQKGPIWEELPKEAQDKVVESVLDTLLKPKSELSINNGDITDLDRSMLVVFNSIVDSLKEYIR
jgi:hypothetical protein